MGLRICSRVFAAATSPTIIVRGELIAKILPILSLGLYPYLLQSIFSSFHSIGGDDFPTLESELSVGLVLTNKMWLPPRE